MGPRFLRPWRVALPLALLLLALDAVEAGATSRFVVPRGNSASCTIQLPCSIAQATAIAGEGDEIVLQPGNYSDAAKDFGGTVVVNSGVSLHGVLGAPRPVITVSTALPAGTPAVLVNRGGSISHLEVITANAPEEVAFLGGLGEDLIVRSTTPGGVACTMFEGVLRNSACLSGGGGLALGSNTGALGPRAPNSIQLRNVTAVASGPGSVGMNFGFTGDFNGIANGRNVRTINGVGVIARGTEHDIVARSISPAPAHPASSGAVMVITLSHSDYADTITSVDVPAAGGSATVTRAGSGTNITAVPRLAADGVHQLPGSPTVDAGALDGLTGASTLDGQPRSIGGAPDIGADEFTGSTITKVSCDLGSLGVGQLTVCTATVANDFEDKVPTGPLSFDNTGPGAFAGSRRCTIDRLEDGDLGCRVSYKPSQVGSGTHTITASYEGDDAHTPSEGTTRVRVLPTSGPGPGGRPETKLKTKPRKQTTKRSARFTFVSVPAGARFQCRLDRGRFKACRSPFRATVKPGRHVFSVRAVDASGQVDTTPANFRWKVGRG